MKKLYSYVLSGSGAEGQTFKVDGRVMCEYPQAFDAVMREAFDKITRGLAVYGKPGVGCAGPYDITSIKIEQVLQ